MVAFNRIEQRFPVAEIALVGIAAIWGLTFVMVQDAVALLPVMTFLAYRFLPAALLIALVFRRDLARLPASGWRSGLVMGAFLTLGYSFQTVGLQHTTASNAGFITGMFVVLTPIFGRIFLGHKAEARAWLAGLASTVGLFLLSGASGFHLLGDGLVFLAACSFSFHILATEQAVRGHHAGALLAVQLGVCGLATLAAATLAGDLEVPRSAVVWNALIVTSLLATALGFFVQTYAQRHAPAARTALILASEPAFAGVFGFLLAGETLTLGGWVGAGLILTSIVVVEAVPYLRPPRPLPEG